MSVCLAAENLTGGYAGTDVVFDLSLEVQAGGILGVFGRNGVGKSTLARLLQGGLTPGSGRIVIDGAEVTSLAAFARRRKGLGYVPQTGMVFDDLTVRQNLTLGATARPLEPYFALFPRLQERLDQPAGTMSGGERKILAFVRAMVEDTHVIVLDEPSEGVQPENIGHMARCLQERAAEGAGVVLIEQNLKLLVAVADRFLGIESGRCVYESGRDGMRMEDLTEVLSV